jgi:hypothetical protein
MNSWVFPKLWWWSKGLLTQWACKWFLTCMNSYVYLRIFWISDGFLTHWTIKWFFPCVTSWVFSEIRRITITLFDSQRDDEELNVFLHNEQANCFSPVCTQICLTKPEFWLKDFTQTGHLKGFSSLCKSGC